MFDFLKRSLRNKLLSIFVAIGFLPFITLLLYTIFLSETKIVNKIVIDQLERTKFVSKLIDNHLNFLKKEVNFLSSLDLMDDILADDIDKRISRLLTQKAKDLNLNLTFMVIGIDNHTIIASSDKEILQKSKKFDFLKNDKMGYFVKDKTIFIYSKVLASFDKTKELGFLILKYDLNNLDTYLTHKKNIHSYITDSKNSIVIGDSMLSGIDFDKKQNYIIDEEHVIIFDNLTSILKNWHIVYAVDKDIALEFLYDFISFMLYMSVVIFVFIIYISIKQSKAIVKPIEELTAITDSIITTQNYSSRLKVDSQDEILILTNSFNEMLNITSTALSNLEKENKLRLKRFTQLIDVFNIIIQTKNEVECIDVSIAEIKKLTNKDNLFFTKDKNIVGDTKYTDLYVTDFQNNQKIYFGSIELGIFDFEDKYEKDFYDSINSMITLQLDRIRLIEKTMSASNAKSAFISNMSHELRTPLNAIIGFAQFMIVYEDLNDDQQDTVSNIESSAQYLLSMINEILDIAKIEAGKMKAYKEDVDLLELIQSIHSMLLPLAQEKDLEFSFTYDRLSSSDFYTDPKMFKQIVVNLVSNAIKFTQNGKISMELFSSDENIVLEIVDTGIGISKDDITQLFSDFTQVENVMQKKHKGTGLGLSLSKKMAHILNGDVYLESDGVGYGTKSVFIIKV